MDRYNRQPFSVHAEFVCSKPFMHDGRQYTRGDTVPTNGIEPRRLRQMWDNRMIDAVAYAVPEKAPATPAQRPQERSKAARAPAAQPKEEVASEDAVAAREGFTIEHRGFGRYFVRDASGAETGPMSKDKAVALAGAAA